MSLHLLHQIEKLKRHILALGSLVESRVEGAIRAVVERDGDLAREIIAGDETIDAMEIDVEEECLQTLALHQPVAHDLRYVIAVLKINNDLERIADQAANIAEQAVALQKIAQLANVPFDLVGEAQKARSMLKTSLDALIKVDPDLADTVRAKDEEVDAIHRAMYAAVQTAIRATPDHVEQYIRYISVSRNLERIADLAVNIAEDVIYMARGDILRHLPPTAHHQVPLRPKK